MPRLSDYPAITATDLADGDLIPVVDISADSPRVKTITRAQLAAGLNPAGLSPTGNADKVVTVKADASGFELRTPTGGGGGGGLVPWAGAMLFMSANQTNANGIEVAFDQEESYSTEAANYHNEGVTPWRLKAYDAGLYLVGFSASLTSTDNGAMYDAYLTRNPAVGSPYAGDYPYGQGFDVGQGYVRIQGQQIMWLPAGLQLSMYVNGSTGNFDISKNETRAWLWKIGSEPTSL